MNRVLTLFSGVSRGTERLVHEGRVPESEYERMACPRQRGGFPFPVLYGYAAVGAGVDGPLTGQTVFCLHPHESLFDAASDDLLPVPADIPADRAVLAANMETALNAMWDSGAGPGDRIAIVGAGGVLGDGQSQPFAFAEDWARYKRITLGHPMIMGRRTHAAIGRFLPGRTTIVVSRHPEGVAIPEGVDAHAVASVDEALDLAASLDDVVYVAGGGEIYRAAWPRLTEPSTGSV